MTAHPLPVGTRVYHYGQQWHRPNMGGTASIVEVDGPQYDGSYEYKVMAGVEFARRTGPENPEVRETWWSSLATRPAMNEGEGTHA